MSVNTDKPGQNIQQTSANTADNFIAGKAWQREETPEEDTVKRTLKPVQKKPGNTGLPDNLKSGIESLGGYDMSDVKVHYNSAKPVQLQALTYARGSDISLPSGQERKLPHEAWHVVQQKQGRVRATLQLKGVGINDDTVLEREADVMGARALQRPAQKNKNTSLDGLSHIQKYSTKKGVQKIVVAQMMVRRLFNFVRSVPSRK